ncbi:methylenetetrahydrofolate dehydrogenase (NADP+)/methenyltetrahydrofolate cyclohydrolase [Clostridium punense]|uniref:Bifunctional protein FolD n=1 Tax=Clostridium punense TaxID=1054297 RepID=A0ABS4K734_9CLOT|nr:MULTISPECIES: tetrahydrofolate dehydrogenase/cyclohydrolase catalytic domain-containing protein [Clostridium]EQB86666.1 hypothetical protein M918_12950 [Clostridium sp. BL8]MBP2023602.1 methylenetetrahydrofolate dehydrogenase (NADP+)/methenyltetrahydrofolate cyclohydrolase [Clostridium punense]
MGIRLNGVELAKKFKAEIKDTIAKEKNMGKRTPSLASIIIGEDGGSLSYIKNQVKISEELGINYEVLRFPKSISEDEIIEYLEELNKSSNVDGIILQLPLPGAFNEGRIIESISYKKDVDSLTDINIGKFYKGEESFIPCTARSVLQLIKSTCDDLRGKKAVVVGRSNIVGKPTSYLLLNEHCTVTICHSNTKELKDICKSADILVTALGIPNFITVDYVKKEAIVIDVGTTLVDGKIRGDVDFDSVIEVASYVSPVPGGVGAMTTTMLMKNTCEAWLKNVCEDTYSNSSK